MNDLTELPEEFAVMLEAAPPWLTRKALSNLSGGLIAPMTIRNRDAQKCGPKGRRRVGKYTVYPKREGIYWLWEYICSCNNKQSDAATRDTLVSPKAVPSVPNLQNETMGQDR